MKMPVATYRLQLSRDFTFDDAAQFLPYFSALNISHLYLSPVLESVPGSSHGYDVTDFSRISEERGGEKGFRKFMQAVSSMDKPLEIILDIVPNHMAADVRNPYWWDVLYAGCNSSWWPLFDFQSLPEGKILLPVLEDSAEQMWRNGKLNVRPHEGMWVLDCNGSLFPLSEGTQSLLQKSPERAGKIRILDEQNYRLVKSSDTDVMSYRRFFHLPSLVGIRMEDEKIFQTTHEKIFGILSEYPSITGLRIDHVDGLVDPSRYLQRLAPEVENIWVEKILARDEAMPEWPVCGTTGYEFMDHASLCLLNSVGFHEIQDWWKAEVEPEWEDFYTCMYEAKREIAASLFSAEVDRISKVLAGEYTEMQAAAREFVIRLTSVFPVYRVYETDSEAAKKDINKALMTAGEIYGESFVMQERRFSRQLCAPETKEEKALFIKWQQLTGAVMAKGLEDTAHYRYTPLAALNEVGSMPAVPESYRLNDFISFTQERGGRFPLSLNATSTHDTKRSEDTRCRLIAIADNPETWKEFCRKVLGLPFGGEGISLRVKYFFLQAVVSTWPLDEKITDEYMARLVAYMNKAAREENLCTSFSNPDKGYEDKLESYVRECFSSLSFKQKTTEFCEGLSRAGAINSLSLLLLKCLGWGVPDIYQGNEVLDFSLVDPDNRRAVDFESLSAISQRLKARMNDAENLLPWLADSWRNGLIKLWLTQKLLDIRRKYIVNDGIASYETLPVEESNIPAAAYLLRLNGGGALFYVHPLHPGKLSYQPGLAVCQRDWGAAVVKLPQDIADFASLDLLSSRKRAAAPEIFIADMMNDLPWAVLYLGRD